MVSCDGCNPDAIQNIFDDDKQTYNVYIVYNVRILCLVKLFVSVN